ncbi:uncharacterized protein LOC131635962 [Vicia villosa]|uniref:uncharacterized protein LOC131635962 n=1 Tax=Vicia villosa TaxID=3911 RepID=UPI00273B6631|nr:uncharacterized protein LOC131635962 [Vicia villosa]
MAERGGRNDDAFAEALGMLAGVLGGNPNGNGIGTNRKLGEFQRNNPPLFKGTYDHEGAHKWLKEIERIFRVDCSRIFKEDINKSKSSNSHELVDKRGMKHMDQGKPYGRGNQKSGGWKRPSGGYSNSPVRCYKCVKTVTCYNFGEEGHISPRCTKLKKNQSGGKVFALSVSETTPEDRLIKVTTSFACLNCPIDIFGWEFRMDLVCLSLEQLDIILGMNWFEFNRVHINCFAKTVIFPDVVSVENLAMTSRQVSEAVEDDVAVFMLFTSMEVKIKLASSELPMVCEFPEVFSEDVRELPYEREVEFAIDLIPGTKLVSMAPYRMSAYGLIELKSQL